jgi:UPF0755 protein
LHYILTFLKLCIIVVDELLYFLYSKSRYLLSVVFIIIFYLLVEYKEKSDISHYKTVYIEQGSTFNQISKHFANDSIITSPFLFKLFSKWMKYDKQIRYGEFSLPVGLNEYDLVNELKKIKQIEHKVTIIEGERYRNLVPVFVKALNLDSQKLVDLYSNKKFLIEMNIDAETLEGYIFPQTYFYSKGITEKQLLSILIKNTKKILEDTTNMLLDADLSNYQILTLASIVQAECIYEDEMPLVASVYLNRLRIGMKLQADPTIQFFLDKPTRLLNRHLKIKNPYNTYQNYGLPPGPINNPGKAAIEAIKNPVKSRYLYFVADGTNGRHIFGRSLIEHNQNRKQLDAIRRELRKKKF